ncbi:hypothetical protein HY345_02960 [Candidatus Microgenomates bacterium]|nr:hypothetical protein [Candidatus Microgenomates bacterium]
MLTAISPIFTQEPIKTFFLNEDFAVTSAFLSLVFGLIIIWLIFEHFRYINFSIGKFKDRGKGFPEPFKWVNKGQFILLITVINFALAFVFFYIKSLGVQQFSIEIQIIQSIIYVIFFVTLMAIFAFLITSTFDRLKYEQQRDDFPWTIFSTLEKNKLVSTGIEFYENKALSRQELVSEGLEIVGAAKKVKVKTIPQPREIIEVIVSFDGKELLKILKKGE